MTFYRPLSLRTGGRKRIFILFFCVIPPSQYPPSGFAGHLLINKEAYPIPILSVRIPFLNTAADPSLMFRMTLNVLCKDYGVSRQKELLAHVVRLRILAACRNDLNRKRIVSLQLTADSSQLIAFIFLPSSPNIKTDPLFVWIGSFVWIKGFLSF